MKKKSFFICFLLVFIGVFSLFGVGLKANAANNEYQVNVDSANCYIFFDLYAYKSNFNFIWNDNRQVIVSFTYDSSNDCYYLNNNTSYVFYDNRQYMLLYQNSINHYVFYELDIPSNITGASQIDIVELLTISDGTRTINNFYIDSRGFQFRVDLGTTDMTTLKQTWYYRYNNSIYNTMRQQYGANRRQEGYTQGYNEGYNEGYDDGQAGENAVSPIWNLFQGIFGTIGAIFTIELAPHVYIGYFFLVPLFFGVVGLILWIWRRN